MKKLLWLILPLILIALILGLSTMKKAPQPTTTPAPTESPEPVPTPEPDTVPATVRYRLVGALYTTFKSGDTVSVTGSSGEWYAVELDGVSVYVEKRFIRLDSEPAAEPREGIVTGRTPVYPDVYLDGAALTELESGTKLKIIENMDWCLMVELADGSTAFLPANAVSIDSTASYDGNDLGTGIIKADGVEGYLRVFWRDAEVNVIADKNGITELLIDGLVATVPTQSLLKQGDKPYEAWEGYIQTAVNGSSDLRMRGDMDALSKNDKVKVIDVFGEVYLVEIGQGLTYLTLGSVGTEEVRVPYYSAPSYSNGGNSGGG